MLQGMWAAGAGSVHSCVRLGTAAAKQLHAATGPRAEVDTLF